MNTIKKLINGSAHYQEKILFDKLLITLIEF